MVILEIGNGGGGFYMSRNDDLLRELIWSSRRWEKEVEARHYRG